MMRATVRAGLACLLAMLMIGAPQTGSVAPAAAACPPGDQTSTPYTTEWGYAIPGGKCIPGTVTPGTTEFSYVYEPLCQPNVRDDCGPRVCFEAEAPARIFRVTRVTLADGTVEYLGGGCYSTKYEPPKVTPGDVLKALKRVPIERSAITVQPPGGRTLVNFKTIVSSKAAPFEVDVPIFDQNVHLWIKPVTWTWDFGDGSDPLVREDGGVAWEDGVTRDEIVEDVYTFHEYTAPEEFDIALTVTWVADYQVDGQPPPAAVPGSVDIASTPVEVEALEAIPHLVEDPFG